MRGLIVFLLMAIGFAQVGNTQNPREDFNKGVDELRNGNVNEAIKFFSSTISKRNEVSDKYLIADAYIARAKCKMVLNNLKGALDDANSAIETKPKHASGYKIKGNVYSRMGMYKEALVAVDSAIKYKPQDEELYLNASKYYGELYQFDQSIQAAHKALEIDPKYSQAYVSMAVTYRKAKEFKKSVIAFKTAYKLDPAPDILIDCGLSRALALDYDSAQIDILKAADLDTTLRTVAYNNIAYFIKFEQKDYQGAVEYFTKAIGLKPNFAYAYNNRGFAWYKLGNYKEANKDIRKSIDMDPKNSYAYKNLALVAIAEGKSKAACDYLEKANTLGYTRDYDTEVNDLIKANCVK